MSRLVSEDSQDSQYMWGIKKKKIQVLKEEDSGIVYYIGCTIQLDNKYLQKAFHFSHELHVRIVLGDGRWFEIQLVVCRNALALAFGFVVLLHSESCRHEPRHICAQVSAKQQTSLTFLLRPQICLALGQRIVYSNNVYYFRTGFNLKKK